MVTPDAQVNFQCRSRRDGSSGQALIEYILVVTVTVIIIATLVQKLYKPMDAFVQNIMGTYIQCLLETGQLPALGAASEDSSGESSCKIDLFAGGGQGKNGDGEKDKNKDDDNADKISNTKKKSGGGGGSVSRASNKAFSLDVSQQRGPRSAEVGSGKGDLGLGAGKQVGSEYFGGGGSYAGGYGRKSRYIAITGMYAEAIAKKKKEGEKGKISSAPAERGGGGSKPRKIALAAPERRARDLGDFNASGLDISQIVKIILIVGIILVLVLLIGGQAVSISKNWEKGE